MFKGIKLTTKVVYTEFCCTRSHGHKESKFDHISPVLTQLNWLSVTNTLDFKDAIINNYWMRLSGISRIIEAEVGVICRSRRLRQITLTEASIILDIPRKPNSIIILLFTWTVLSFTWIILLFTWADTKIMI